MNGQTIKTGRRSLLNLIGYEFVKYGGGTGLLIVDWGLTSVRVSWRSGVIIKRIGKILVVNEMGELFTKYPQSQDHRKYIKISETKKSTS